MCLVGAGCSAMRARETSMTFEPIPHFRRFAVVALAVAAGGCASDDDPAAGPTSATSHTEIAVGDFVFDALVAGPEDGEVVFLLHGFPQTSYEWRHQLTALAEAGYRAIAPDQRGYSPRARPTAVADYAITTLTQDVIGMADAVGAQRFHVVGHDWGASVAWALAVINADRVITVNPISVPHLAAFAVELADPTSCQYAASSYIDVFITPEATDSFLVNDNESLRAIYGDLPAEDVEVYVDALGSREAIDAALNWYRANLPQGRATVPPAFPAVTIPTLFTWSDGDIALCREGAEATQNFVTGPYQFEILAGVDHWVPDKASDRYNPLLLEHLAAFAEAP
jgi:pimeloyl-ACP methyl ester carboxylesterase